MIQNNLEENTSLKNWGFYICLQLLSQTKKTLKIWIIQ